MAVCMEQRVLQRDLVFHHFLGEKQGQAGSQGKWKHCLPPCRRHRCREVKPARPRSAHAHCIRDCPKRCSRHRGASMTRQIWQCFFFLIDLPSKWTLLETGSRGPGEQEPKVRNRLPQTHLPDLRQREKHKQGERTGSQKAGASLCGYWHRAGLGPGTF